MKKILLITILLLSLIVLTGCESDEPDSFILENRITTTNNFTTVNNLSNNYYLSSATGAGVAGQVARWVNNTHLNASSVLSDNGFGVGIGDTTPTEGGARLVICCGVTAQASNMTIISNLGVNYGSEVTEVRVPSIYNVPYPSYFRWYMQGATGDSLFGIVVTNFTGAQRQLLTIDGGYNAVLIGDTSDTTVAFKVQNLHRKAYPVLVTDTSDNLLFRINDTGAIALATTAKLGIGTGTTPPQQGNTLEIKGGTTGVLFNATILTHSGANYGSDVALNFLPRDNGIDVPATILGTDEGATNGVALRFLVQNTTGTQVTVLTLATNTNVGIHDTTPSYPLEVNKLGTSGISIYALGNVSATGYITRTDVYKGTDALSKIKNSTEYIKADGKIDHKAFGYSYVNYTRTEFNISNNQTTIITEEGVDLVKEIALLKQALYEAKLEIEKLQEKKQDKII